VGPVLAEEAARTRPVAAPRPPRPSRLDKVERDVPVSLKPLFAGTRHSLDAEMAKARAALAAQPLPRKAHALAGNSLAGAAGGGLPEHRWVQEKLIRAVRLVARAWRDARTLGTAAPGATTPGATAPGYPGGRVVLPPLGVADGFGYQREMEGLLRSLVGSPTVY